MGYKVAPTTWKVSAKLSEMTGKLAALDRYERRALSRRKFAIREFDKERLRTYGIGVRFWQNEAIGPGRSRAGIIESIDLEPAAGSHPRPPCRDPTKR